MADPLSKPLSDLKIEDIQSLIDEGYPEGYTVEYKEALPHRRGGQDPWYVREDASISEYARDEVLAELVAFANSHGGTLFLGVAESTDKPPRAVGMKPIPRCHDLAERLRLQLRECVEPQVPLVSSCGVELRSEDAAGSGVVAVRVERSYLAPHRLRGTRECYTRRDDRTEKMTMREIQDLTLQMSRGTERLDGILRHRSQLFARELGLMAGVQVTAIDKVGVRVTAAPVWPLLVDGVYGDETVFPRPRAPTFAAGEHDIDMTLPGWPFAERPIVRGSRRTGEHVVQELYCDGLAEIRFAVPRRDDDEPTIYPDWILCAVANVAAMVEAYRSKAAAPGAEFALEVEVAQSRGDVDLRWFSDWKALDSRPFESPLLLPRLSIGPKSELPLVVGQVMVDLQNASGLDSWSGPFTLDLP